MSKMKILVVPSWYPPAGGRFFRLQSEALAKLGHQVDVLILEERGISQKINKKINNSKSPWVNEIRFQYWRIPKLNRLNISLFIKKYQSKLTEYLKTHKPDVIHIHSAIWAGVVVSKIAQQNGIPYIITEHRSLFFEDKIMFGKKNLQAIVSALDQAGELVAVSEKLKERLQLYTKNKISVIPNMVNTEVFEYRQERKKSKQFVFISVGNLIPIKGFDLLINAFSRLKSDKQIVLKIVGKGSSFERLKKQVEQLNLEQSVEFCGYLNREELCNLFQESDAFVLASRKETFGLATAEALCCGLPVIATKSGGPQGIITRENGYLAEVDNENNLLKKMQLMIEKINIFDPSKISADALKIYSEEAVGFQLEKILKNGSKNN